ncbi:MAG: TM2 domain-containing protein [Clostridia bacterium]|nr:TM2 domain-containing protein [Clostridia bacterium]
MAKIISINNQIISIGTDNGGIEEVRADDLNFVPHIGDEVEIFKTETKIIVSKVEPKKSAMTEGGININLSNTQQNNAQPATTAPSGKVVNKLVYCILAFFLGGLGIHKFFAGRTGAGIAFILFSWTFIPAFIALIDFIVGLTKKADANGNIII